MTNKKKEPDIKLGRARWHIRGTTQRQESGKLYNRQKAKQEWKKEE